MEYQGIVTPVATSSCAFITYTDIYGNYSYIARPGEIISPEVKNDKGETVIPGNTLLLFDKRYWNAVLDQYRANYKESVKITELAEINVNRYKKLSFQNASSELSYYYAKFLYNNAAIAMLTAEAAYKQYQIQVDKYQDIAPFEGMVTKNDTTIGQTTGSYKALELAQLNPIGIKVKMDRNTAKAIGNNTPVKIIPMNTDEPQGIIYGSTVLTEDGIEFVTENYPVIEGTKIIPDNTIPIIRNWAPVRKFYIDRNPEVLSVPAASLQKDGDNTYVWRGKGQKTMQSDKSLDYYFEIEKVYITPENMIRAVDNFENKIALQDKGSLELYDLIMYDPPPNLHEGEKVLYPEEAYLLMPGDTVKVIIGE